MTMEHDDPDWAATGLDETGCDGLHDEGVPAHHLCTRCFPDLVAGILGDLAEPEDDEYQPDEEPEEEEME